MSNRGEANSSRHTNNELGVELTKSQFLALSVEHVEIMHAILQSEPPERRLKKWIGVMEFVKCIEGFDLTRDKVSRLFDMWWASERRQDELN